jgi:hypothetical protein
MRITQNQTIGCASVKKTKTIFFSCDANTADPLIALYLENPENFVKFFNSFYTQMTLAGLANINQAVANSYTKNNVKASLNDQHKASFWLHLFQLVICHNAQRPDLPKMNTYFFHSLGEQTRKSLRGFHSFKIEPVNPIPALLNQPATYGMCAVVLLLTFCAMASLLLSAKMSINAALALKNIVSHMRLPNKNLVANVASYTALSCVLFCVFATSTFLAIASYNTAADSLEFHYSDGKEKYRDFIYAVGFYYNKRSQDNPKGVFYKEDVETLLTAKKWAEETVTLCPEQDDFGYIGR